MRIAAGSLSCDSLGSYKAYGNYSYGWGTMLSETFTVNKDMITFCYSHGAGSGYVALVSAADGAVLLSDSGSGATVNWNVAPYIGKGVHLEIWDKHAWTGSRSVSADGFRYYDPLDHYHIDFDPEVAATNADFRISFTPHTAGEVARFGGSQVQINAYVYSAASGNWDQPASGNLKMVDSGQGNNGYDANGLPYLVNPVVDASATAGQITVKLRYDIQEQTKLQLVDENNVVSSLTDAISVGSPNQIVNGGFESYESATVFPGWTASGVMRNLTKTDGLTLSCGESGSQRKAGSYTSGQTGSMTSDVFTITGDEIGFCYGIIGLVMLPMLSCTGRRTTA
jgi:hypothetical protein